jgi:hypothetical protein
MRSQKPLDVDYIEALDDFDTRTEFIHREPVSFGARVSVDPLDNLQTFRSCWQLPKTLLQQSLLPPNGCPIVFVTWLAKH